MACWHVGPCGPGCDGYPMLPQPQPTPVVPLVYPVPTPVHPQTCGYCYADMLEHMCPVRVTKLRAEVEQLRDDLKQKELQYNELLTKIEAFKCSEKAQECTARHIGYNLAIEDVLELLRSTEKRKEGS